MCYNEYGDNMNREFCASAFVIDPTTKKILLVKHKKFNKWVQPGGHVMPNEVFEETAEREVYEETKVKIKLIGDRFPRESDYVRPLGIQKNYGEKCVHVDVIYAAVPIRDQLLTYDPKESLNVGWFSREELEDLDIFPDIKITMDYILKNIIH